MSASIAATFYNIGYAQTVAQSMEKNQVDVLVLTPNQYMSILQDKAKNNPHLEYTLRKILGSSIFGQYWTKTFSPNASHPLVGPLSQFPNDVVMITKTLNAIGMSGITSYIKHSGNKTYIIIKGHAANRSSVLQGTRYLATHPQMIQLGLGMKGVGNVAKGGFILGLVVSSGIEVMDFIFNDEKTMYDLVGGIGVEAVKGGLAGLLAYSVAAGIGMITGVVAIAPLVVMAVAAFGFGVAINYADNTLGIKSKVIEILKAVPDDASQGLYYIKETATSWEEKILNSVQQKKIGAGRAIDNGLRDWLCRINCRRY
jgi:hypothetical protein